ncbi:hypothetical protein C3486_06175 [Streptomyces sp. Ru73]|uniref:hypothetical protein n=1 Tax=Streptomyces sp. Ru73 TaxID=2080748 RepID=UPI000CDD300C|nr:hypothetical protein [Streptomyces sp. Ru73]POX42065.1 hypothetical protein C3486_06175 [Streptomyces sp. Ru73]
MSAPDLAGRSLLVVIDPVARRVDGESVRIAKDVLCAAATTKICFPDDPGEFARVLARRGQRRPVVIGDDRALVRTVELLHKERELSRVALSLVPVGAPGGTALCRALGVPTDTVSAARAVLDGQERALDLLSDDSDGIVLGGLRIPGGDLTEQPAGPAPAAAEEPVVPAQRPWWTPAARTARAALSLLTAPVPGGGTGRGRRGERMLPRLRVEADGVVLADLDRPVHRVSVAPVGCTAAHGVAPGAGAECPSQEPEGLAEVVVQWHADEAPVRVRARAVTVSGPDFRYRADAVIGGPVRTRTWTVQPSAWRLTLPRR